MRRKANNRGEIALVLVIYLVRSHKWKSLSNLRHIRVEVHHQSYRPVMGKHHFIIKVHEHASPRSLTTQPEPFTSRFTAVDSSSFVLACIHKRRHAHRALVYTHIPSTYIRRPSGLITTSKGIPPDHSFA